MLAPGTGKTQTARLWTYARDERPWGGLAPPAAWYCFSGDRKGQHPKDHLAGYRGWMHADGYAGFEELYRSGAVREVACMAHIRRKFVDIYRSQGSAVAEEAIARIAKLFAVEKEAPYAVAAYKASDEVIEVGRAKYRGALQLLQWCRTRGSWPGYQPNGEIETINLPRWAANFDLEA